MRFKNINTPPLIEIYILSRDREEYLLEAVRSASEQDYPNYKIIVSDNSTNNSLHVRLSKNFPMVEIRRRSGYLDATNHINIILSEVSSEYFVLFHDDDILKPNFLTELMSQIIKCSKISMVGCNANLLFDNFVSRKTTINPLKKKKAITIDVKEFNKRYTNIFYNKPAPFSSYLYRKSSVNPILPYTDRCGKYSDVSFLSDVASQGKVRILTKNLMLYRLHSSNDSVKDVMIDRVKLFKHLQLYVSKRSLIKFRIYCIFNKKRKNYGNIMATLFVMRKFRWLKLKI